MPRAVRAFTMVVTVLACVFHASRPTRALYTKKCLACTGKSNC